MSAVCLVAFILHLCCWSAVCNAAEDNSPFLSDGIVKAPGEQVIEPLPPGAVRRFGTSRLTIDAEQPGRMFYMQNGSRLAVEFTVALTMFDRESGNRIPNLKYDTGPGLLNKVTPSPDSSIFALVSHVPEASNGRIVLIGAAKKRQVLDLAFPGSVVSCLAINKDNSILAIGAYSNGPDIDQIQLWDLGTGKLISKIPHANDIQPHSLSFSVDGKRLVAVGEYKSIIWKWQTDARPTEMPEWKDDAPVFVQHTGNGSWLLIGNRKRNALKILDATTAKVLWEIETATEFDNKCLQGGLSKDGQRVAVIGTNSTSVEIWDLHGRKRVQAIEFASCNSLALSPNGQYLAVATNQNRIYQWNLQSNVLSPPLPPGHVKKINRLSFSADGRLLRTMGFDSVCTWDVGTGAWLSQHSNKSYLKNLNIPFTPLFVPDISWLTVLESEVGLKVYDRFTNQFVCHLHPKGRLEPDLAVTLSPDKQRVFYYAKGFQLATFEAPTGKQLSKASARFARAPMNATQNGIKETALFSPQSNFLFVAHEHQLTLVDTVTGKPLQSTTDDRKLIDFKFSPDEKWLLTMSYDADLASGKIDDSRVIITQRRVETLESVREFSTAGPISAEALAFSTDSNSFAMFHGKSERWIEIIETRTGKTTARIKDVLKCENLEFSPDGRYLATANGATDVLLWDLTNPELKP